ncbi:MAG: hypothetical protein EOP11_11740 [Proteobacteria bacterium]|nr:MAG: hypothetical protein EOP11_11740 [Pseudomonadota bacterium]
MDTTIPMDIRTEAEGPGPLRAFFTLLNHALVHPARFFREDLPRLSTAEVLSFGIGNAWAAAAIAFFFQTFNAVVLSQIFEKWVQRLLASEDAFRLIEFSGQDFVWNAGALVLAPFLLLLRLVFGTSMLYFFSRLFIEDHPSAPEKVTYTGAMRIQASAYVSQWYLLVPFFGAFLAFVVGLVLQITGVRERFLVSTRRATVVVLAPYLLLLMAGLFLTALLVFAVSQFPIQDLLDLDNLGFPFPKV